MPRRSSTGELVPRDISEILAREAKAHRGQRKQGGPLGQAFCWLKGSRKKAKKNGPGNGVIAAGTPDTAVERENHAPGKAGPRRDEAQKGLSVHYRASQHYPENVFIEGNRSRFLDDLHTEAQEGLKILRQEEHDIVGSFADDSQSVSSTNTLRPEQDLYSLDSGCSPGHEITGSSVTTLTTAAPATSTRPVLTRQASTFKPLSSTETLKRPDKSRKKGRRTTIMGIPQQVQRELAQQRSSTFQPIGSQRQPTDGDEQVNDGLSGVVVIPTINGETPIANQEGARVNLSDLEVSREDQLLRKHLQAVYQDEQLSSPQDPGYHLMTTISQRPKSLAVPGMTTSSSALGFLHEPQGPVMSISPQATYLSKIIPNAVLPASVEVIQINRCASRPLAGLGMHGGSVRAVSKGSLVSADLSASPASSRRSDGDGSNADNSQTSSTALGSNRSRSRSSSEMTMSNASAALAKRGADTVAPQAAQGGSPSPAEPDGGQDHVSVCSSMSWMSSPSDRTGSPGKSQGSDCEASGSVSGGEDVRASGHSLTRNLSVVKTKLPPTPPQRTNSLHGNKVRKRSNDLLVIKDPANRSVSGAVNANADTLPSQAEVQIVHTESPANEAPLISVAVPSSRNEVQSSLSADSFNPFPECNSGAGEASQRPSVCSSAQQKTLSEGSTSERTMSPSSGYSSRSGTPTASPKDISPVSPDKQKRPVKPERSGSRASSSPGSPSSSSLTSLSSTSSDPTHQDVSAAIPSTARQPSPPSTGSIPHVCFSASLADREVFNIPPPPKVRAPCAPPPEVWTHSKHSVDLLLGPPSLSSRPETTKTHSSQSVETQTEAHQGAADVDVIKDIVPQEKTMLEDILETVNQVLGHKVGGCLAPEKVDPTAEVQKEEQSSSPSIKDTEGQEKTLKKPPPPVMRKTTPVTIREELLWRRTPTEGHLQQQANCNDERDKFVSGHVPTPSLQPDVQVDQSDGEAVKHMQTTAAETPNATQRVDKGSPPPSPPPAYHPTPPPSRKTPPSPISIPSSVVLEGVQEEAHAVEACWPPPPPPPLEGDMTFEGGDEVDFPPPPPFVTEILPDVVDGCISATEDPRQPGAASEEAKLMIEYTCSTEGQSDPKEVMSTSMKAEEGRRPRQGAVQCTDLDVPYKVLQEIQPLSEVVPSPPKEATPTLSPVTTPETPLSNPTVLPSSVSPALLAQTQGPEAHIHAPFSPPVVIPQAPSPPADKQCTSVNFRRQPSLANRDTRSKEILARHKSVPIPKEDANIPLVTPSLLQMVRLRTVSMVEDEMSATQTEDLTMPANLGLKSAQEDSPVPASGNGTPQKPLRKSLSYKSAHTVKASSVTLNSPSMRLQEAIRMKTAAMSPRDCLPSRLGSRLPASSCSFGEPGAFDPLRSPASTASFIFSKSTKKVVIETASAPEAHAGLKQSLAAELAKVTERAKDSAVNDDQGKCDKVPPPVAKKPIHGSGAPSERGELRTEDVTADNGGGETAPPAEATTTTVTPDTIETLF